MQAIALGMPWFEEDDYDSFRAVLPNRSWHATWSLWRDAAEQNLQRLQREGHVAVKAHIKSDEFVAWCRNAGINVDAKALTTFAAEYARRFSDRELH